MHLLVDVWVARGRRAAGGTRGPVAPSLVWRYGSARCEVFVRRRAWPVSAYGAYAATPWAIHASSKMEMGPVRRCEIL